MLKPRDSRLAAPSAMLNLEFRPEFKPHPSRRDSSLPEAKKKPAPVTYADAGVDISSGDRAKQRIKYLAQRTFSRNVLGEIGGFGGLFRLDGKYEEPVLVSSADGVGTKL